MKIQIALLSVLSLVAFDSVLGSNNVRRLKKDKCDDDEDREQENQDVVIDPNVCIDPFSTIASVAKSHPLTTDACNNNICGGGCCRLVADTFVICDKMGYLATDFSCLCANDGSQLPQQAIELPSAMPSSAPTGVPTLSPAPTVTSEPTGEPTGAPTAMPISIPGVTPAQQDASSKACLSGHPTWTLPLPQAKCTDYNDCDGIPGTCCVKSFCRCSSFTDASYTSVCVLPPVG